MIPPIPSGTTERSGRKQGKPGPLGQAEVLREPALARTRRRERMVDATFLRDVLPPSSLCWPVV